MAETKVLSQRANFSGTAFPVTGLFNGLLFLRTDQNILYFYNGVSFVSISGATGSGSEHARSGMQAEYSSASSLLITAGRTNLGAFTVTKTANSTIDVTMGANYVSGSPAANQYVAALTKADGTIKLTTANPTDADVNGFTDGRKQYKFIAGDYWRYLGMRRTDGAGNLLPFFLWQKMLIYGDHLNVLTSGTSTTFSPISLATRVAPTSRMGYVAVRISASADPSDHFVRPTGGPGDGLRNIGASDSGRSAWRWVPTDSAQSIDYKVQSGNMYIDVGGFMEDLD